MTRVSNYILALAVTISFAGSTAMLAADSAEAYLEEADRALKNDAPLLAIAFTDKSIQVKPTGQAYALKAQALMALHDYANTIKVASKGIALDANLGLLYRVRGEARLITGDKKGCLADAVQASDLDPTNPLLLYNVALTITQYSANYKEAIGYYDKSIAILKKRPKVPSTEPKNKQDSYWLAAAYGGRAHCYIALKDARSALNDLDLAIQQDDKSNYYETRGELKAMLGDSKGALTDFNRAIEKNPKNTLAIQNRAKLKTKSGANASSNELSR